MNNVDMKILSMELFDDKRIPHIRAKASVVLLLFNGDIVIKLNDIRVVQPQNNGEFRVRLPAFKTFSPKGDMEYSSYFVLPYELRGQLNSLVLHEYRKLVQRGD